MYINWFTWIIFIYDRICYTIYWGQRELTRFSQRNGKLPLPRWKQGDYLVNIIYALELMVAGMIKLVGLLVAGNELSDHQIWPMEALSFNNPPLRLLPWKNSDPPLCSPWPWWLFPQSKWRHIPGGYGSTLHPRSLSTSVSQGHNSLARRPKFPGGVQTHGRPKFCTSPGWVP